MKTYTEIAEEYNVLATACGFTGVPKDPNNRYAPRDVANAVIALRELAQDLEQTYHNAAHPARGAQFDSELLRWSNRAEGQRP